MALIAKHCENKAMAKPRCWRGVSSTIASAAVGKKAASPKAIGIIASAIRLLPPAQSADPANRRQPVMKPRRPMPKPKRRLRLATQFPIGH